MASLVACAAVLAAPASAPRGDVLDLVGAPLPVTGAAAEPGGLPGSSAELGALPGAPADPPPTARPADAQQPAPVSPAQRAEARDPDPTPEPEPTDAPGPTAPPLDRLEGYVWPIAHPRLTLPFGPTGWGSRIVNGERFHDGIDLATFCGDRIMAAHAGTVLAAGRRFDDYLGWIGDLEPYYRRLDAKNLWSTLPIIVVVDDGNGYRSVYAHFSRIVVRKGQRVDAGDLLGYEGDTGRASGCHLHYTLFSPFERDTFGIRPDVAKRMKLPLLEIARVDPLLVLPPRKGIPAPSTAP